MKQQNKSRETRGGVRAFAANLWSAVSLMLLILVFWLDTFLRRLETRVKPIRALRKLLGRCTSALDPVGLVPSISRLDLIRLALNNMKQKKARTMVTIGGMVIGIGTIVFLLAIGYGLQNLVIGRVARLDELRQTDVTVPPGSNLALNEDTLREFARIPDVDSVAPVIALVANASYQNSSTDLVAYGVTRDYLEQSAIKPVRGEMFTHNDITLPDGKNQGGATAEAESSETVPTAELRIQPDAWVEVRDQANQHAKLLGYTKDSGQVIAASRVQGNEYLIGDVLTDEWYEVSIPVWIETEDGYAPQRNDAGTQVSVRGYISKTAVEVISESSASAQNAASEVVTRNVDVSKDVSNQVVVNRATLQVLGLSEDQALGVEFDLSFVVTGELLSNKNEKLQSNPLRYKIIGITPDDQSPVIYVPFIDLRRLEIDNFSQVKVSVIHESRLGRARDHIENLGYNTKSVSDTVSQINSIFSTAKIMLGLLGAIALAIASLGMFNTLTVSLLERTREVGLMKAMGLKPSEARELFLAESMIMGSLGGFGGLFFGFAVAKVLEVVISVYTLYKGVGYISIVSVPLLFAVFIIVISFVVGLLTGLFPARRSTRISALNALRYE